MKTTVLLEAKLEESNKIHLLCYTCRHVEFNLKISDKRNDITQKRSFPCFLKNPN